MEFSGEALERLVRKIDTLTDRQDILDCIVGYGRGLDRLDPDFIRGAFHPGGIDDHGAFVGDVDEFVPWAIDCESAFKLTHHSMTSHSCEIEGDTAHTETYVDFYVLFQEDSKVGVGVGRYIDKLERRDDRWGITVRRFVLDFLFDAKEAQWLGSEWSAGAPKRSREDLTYQRPLKGPLR